MKEIAKVKAKEEKRRLASEVRACEMCSTFSFIAF